MPSEGSKQVADDPVATETPAGGAEAVASAAEDVEQPAPLPAGSIAEASTSWADLSEVSDAPVPSGIDSSPSSAHPQGLLSEVKEEIHEAETLNAVISTIGLPEVVADEIVATEEVEEAPTQDQSFLEDCTELENPAEAAFTDISAKEEELHQDLPSTLPEQVETSDLADPVVAGEDTTLAEVPEAETEGLTADASKAAVTSEPVVADTPGVATKATVTDSSELVPPPTSPNLVDPGTEPIQVGHSPSAPSKAPKAPRTRVRSSRGGATTRWQEARRGWWVDFEAYQNLLYQNSGGSISGGFWLRRIPYEQASEDQRWVIALHSRFVEEFTTSNCLAYNVFASYQDWAHQNGLDRRRGVAHGRQVIDSGDLPPRRIINARILGAEHPRVEERDTYYRYVGPQQQPRPKGKAAAPASAGGAAGTGSVVAAPAEQPVPKEPKQPGYPPPNWQPSLRGLDHPVQPVSTSGPKVTSSVRTVPKPPQSDSQEVAAFGRDAAPVPVASSPAKPPAKARPKAPESKAAETLADRIRNLPPPSPGVAPRLPPLPPPSYPPPSDNIPPPPSHPPPSLEKLAAGSSQPADARNPTILSQLKKGSG